MKSIGGQGTITPIYTLWQMIGYMAGLGTWWFGGPVALVGYMHRDLRGSTSAPWHGARLQALAAM